MAGSDVPTASTKISTISGDEEYAAPTGTRELIGSAACIDVAARRFKHTKVVWKEGDAFYVAYWPHRVRPGSNYDLATLKADYRIPLQEVHPPFEAGMIAARSPLSEGAYLKNAVLMNWREGTTFVADNLLREAKLLEDIQARPHPSIVGYYGCVVDPSTNRVTGIVLQKLGSTLHHAKEDGQIQDPPACLKKIRAGIEHLHGLGICHNDLNPLNILLDGKGSPVIIDFDSASPEGFPIGKGCTPGWTIPDVCVSAPQNDWYSFGLLEKFLVS